MSTSTLGCDPDSDKNTAAPVTTEVNFDLALTAVDHGAGGDDHYEADLHFDAVSSCIYKRGTPSLALTLSDGVESAIDIFIDAFDGPGAYTAKGDDATETNVAFRVFFTSLTEGMDDGVIKVGTWNAEAKTSFPCQIDVIDSNLADLEFTNGQSTGWATLKVSCTTLSGAQLGEVEATLEPTSFEFTVADCDAYDG